MPASGGVPRGRWRARAPTPSPTGPAAFRRGPRGADRSRQGLSRNRTQNSLDPLIAATRDNDPEIQIRATDGLVNFYVPGYVRTGLSSTLRRAGNTIKGRFTDINDQVIDLYVVVRPEVIQALGQADPRGRVDGIPRQRRARRGGPERRGCDSGAAGGGPVQGLATDVRRAWSLCGRST